MIGRSQWRRRKSIPRDGRRRDAGVRVPSEMAKQLKKKLGKKNSVNVWSVTAGPKMGPKKRKKQTKQFVFERCQGCRAWMLAKMLAILADETDARALPCLGGS